MRRTALAVLVAVVAGSCSGSADPGAPGPGSPSTSPSSSAAGPSTPAPPPEPLALTVAFVEAVGDAVPPDPVTAAFQAARLAFSNAEVVTGLPVDVEVRAYDTDGDPAETAEVAAEIAAAPEIVAAIAAPGLTQQGAFGDALDAAGVPWLSLSGVGSDLGDRGWVGWRRLVADQATQGAVLGEAVDDLRPSELGVCMLGDGTAPARSLLGAAVRTFGDPVVLRRAVPEGQPDVAAAAQAVATSGCGVVLWGGDASVGAALRRQLIDVGLRQLPFVGSDRIRDRSFLEASGPAGEGTLAACPCVDVSTSTDLAAQRFIQDYQSEFGLPPGPYAVEAWDAARMLVAALREGAVTRASIRSAMAASASFDGLAGIYRFGPGGDLAEPSQAVRLSRVEGGRWLQIPSTEPGS